MCEIKSGSMSPCSYTHPLVNKAAFDPNTGEVWDEFGNLIGQGKPIVVQGEVTAIDVSPINHPLTNK